MPDCCVVMWTVLIYCKPLYHGKDITKFHDSTGLSMRDHRKFNPVTVLCFFLRVLLKYSSHKIYKIIHFTCKIQSFLDIHKFLRQLSQSLMVPLNREKIILTPCLTTATYSQLQASNFPNSSLRLSLTHIFFL